MELSDPSPEPSMSLWQGIFGFPFQLDNIKAYIIVTLCAIVLAFDATGFAITGELINSSIPEGKELIGVAPPVFFSGMRIYWGLAVLAFVASLAPAAFFIIILQDTAAGNEDIDWPDDVWYEYITKIVFLGWLFGCCAAISTVFWSLAALAMEQMGVPIPAIIWWVFTLVSAFMLFPIPLYSTMIGGSPFMLIHPMFLLRLIQRPLAGLALYGYTFVLLLPCVALGLWMIVSLSWWAAPIVGLIWATCILWYARALGRVGYVLAEEKRMVRRKKKRRRVRVRRETAD
jgi:hypothetical protein